MEINLHPEDRDLLREVISRRPSAGLTKINVDKLVDLSIGELQSIVDAIAAEMRYSGFGQNWEPNPRGLDLERLMDAFNGLLIKMKG